jgi:hypothetical protein
MLFSSANLHTEAWMCSTRSERGQHRASLDPPGADSCAKSCAISADQAVFGPRPPSRCALAAIAYELTRELRSKRSEVRILSGVPLLQCPFRTHR